MFRISKFSIRPTRTQAIVMLVIAAAVSLGAAGLATHPSARYVQHNLVSDVPGAADHTDSNLVNAWGIASSPTTSPWWVADNATGVSTLYDQHGVANMLVVNVPGADGTPNGGAPTGIVFHDPSDGQFVVSDGMGNSGPAVFMFASEDGTISGWAPGVPPPPPSHQAQIAIDDSDENAIYKGLALASTTSGPRLYTTDFHNNRIEVYGGDFEDAVITGDFHDSQIPHGYAPFGIAAINGKIFVSYAKQDADAHDNLDGPGLGFVNVFDTDGNLLQRLIRHGKLNAPWGMVQAPSNFGQFSNALLVGNFGDGRINAYNIDTGEGLGTLVSKPGHPIQIDGLWGLGFGNGGAAGPTNVLYFAAGPDDETHGLFGSISAAE